MPYKANARPSQTWGPLRRTVKWSAGVWLGGGVIRGKGTVHHRGADLQHSVSATWRPAHLLIGAHAPVQQALHCTFGRRRGDGLAPVLSGLAPHCRELGHLPDLFTQRGGDGCVARTASQRARASVRTGRHTGIGASAAGTAGAVSMNAPARR